MSVLLAKVNLKFCEFRHRRGLAKLGLQALARAGAGASL